MSVDVGVEVGVGVRVGVVVGDGKYRSDSEVWSGWKPLKAMMNSRQIVAKAAPIEASFSGRIEDVFASVGVDFSLFMNLASKN